MEVRSNHPLLKPMTREMAQSALTRLRSAQDAHAAVVEGDRELGKLVRNAENQEELDFVSISRQLLSSLSSPPKAPSAEASESEKAAWAGRRDWAARVARPGLECALRMAAEGLAPGGVGTAIFMVTEAVLKEAGSALRDDPKNAVSVSSMLKDGILRYQLELEDKAALHCWETLSKGGVPATLTVELAQDVIRHALTDAPCKPFHQTVAKVALVDLAGETDRGEFLSHSARYFPLLKDRLPEGAPKLPYLSSDVPALGQVRNHLGFYETLASL